ncbi:MAG TPA: RNA polymerase sigma factor [Polyangiaceae bacterium]|nr:RNA polymerase sigma factor [Polyangiaceae bacterium]
MTFIPVAWGAVSSAPEGEALGGAERALLARARAGEVEALRSLYDRHAPAVRRFLEGLLGDAAAADDGTQEAFARAFRRLATLGECDRLAPWLFGIARNVAYELKRGRRRDAGGAGAGRAGGEAGAADGARPGDEPAEGRTPEDELLGREAVRAVDRALGQLNDDRRAALLLRVDHELAYDEIARLMGWSLAKVKVEIHRARLALRAQLDDNEGGAQKGGGW